MQTILGAGGAIGVELARALPQHTTDVIRLVSRNPKKVNDTDALLSADLNDWAQVSRAVAGSTIVYLTIGYDYNTKLWQERWPVLIKNVVDACIDHQSKLVFFDNVYAIGGDNVTHITEASPMSPCSKKGDVRAAVDRHILEAVEAGKLDAIIARAPDFFGPIKDKSLIMNLIYDNMMKDKKAQWFCNADKIHSTGYTPDLGIGTAMLGNAPTAYNQIWNLPVDPHAPTGREGLRAVCPRTAQARRRSGTTRLGDMGIRSVRADFERDIRNALPVRPRLFLRFGQIQQRLFVYTHHQCGGRSANSSGVGKAKPIRF